MYKIDKFNYFQTNNKGKSLLPNHNKDLKVYAKF